ncbi:hypothetical protein ACWKWP_03710 [Agromyces soli]
MTIAADASAASVPALDRAAADEASGVSPFTMLPGAVGAMVCEGDVCYVPGFGDAAAE